MKKTTTIEKLATPITDLIIHVESTSAFRDAMKRNIPETHKATLRTTIPNAPKMIANSFTTKDPGEYYLDLAGIADSMQGALDKLESQIEAAVPAIEGEMARIEVKGEQGTLTMKDELRLEMLEQRLQLLMDYLHAIGKM